MSSLVATAIVADRYYVAQRAPFVGDDGVEDVDESICGAAPGEDDDGSAAATGSVELLCGHVYCLLLIALVRMDSRTNMVEWEVWGW